jgi:CDP-6-deoxy-D-xylo-4-hexulose-3-dehydrase
MESFEMAASKWWYPTGFAAWGDEERHAINCVMKSGRFTCGERVAAFEEAFARYHGRKYGIMCNSGSSANLLMIATLFHLQNRPLQRGDVALVPAIAWSTTYAPLVQYGLHISLMDCDATWNANTFYRPCRLVVGCSILGNPADLSNLAYHAGECGAYFIEDNCESFDARLPATNGDVSAYGDFVGVCGTYGVMSSFSFFYSHQISAIEGGMVLTDDKEMATLCRMLRAHGWSRDVEPPAHFDQEYDFRVFGYNVRPLELHAAIAHVQLSKQVEHKRLRQQNMKLFRELTRGLPIKHPTPYGDMNPFCLNFIVDHNRDGVQLDNSKRADLVRALRAASIDCRLPTGGSFRKHKYGRIARHQETPNADRIHDTGLFLGNGALDLSERIGRAVAIMKDVLA